MLTEKEVAASWRKLFSQREMNDEVVAKAQSLIDNLRPESPLRHRLDSELEELMKVAEQRA
ncbi:MAG: hypothetical protein DCC68_02320 [Planctomycetota bacterium]|nr:MAG: hypothetical protein DCC68_02320 [Planctomycetota bacterium]